MKNHIIYSLFFTLITFSTFAQKHVDIYRSGTYYKSFSTIDSAINAANLIGDSLVLSAHTFYESNLGAQKKVLKFCGTILAGDTSTIDAGGKETILNVNQIGLIKDIILQNATVQALGILTGLTSDTFHISGNTIIRNNILGNDNTIINGSRNLIIEGNTKILNNTARSVFSPCYLEIKDNVILANNHMLTGSDLYFKYKYGLIFQPLNGSKITGKVQIINNTTDSNATAGISIFNLASTCIFSIGDSVVIKGNKSLTPGYGKGAAIYFGTPGTLYAGGLTSFKIGAMTFEDNEAIEGGAIYCEDSSIKIEFNGTVFKGNKARKGGAIYTRGSLDIKNANFIDNIADTALSIFINTAVGGSISQNVNVESSRFYNIANPANKQNHIYATYRPLTGFPPSVSLMSNWWGKSDTIGVLKEYPKGLCALNYWAVANWSVKNGTSILSSDTIFPVSASIKYNHGIAFPASSFTKIKGTFTADTGTFSPVTATINSANIVSSTYKTFKDSSSKSTNVNIIAWIDADTFRKTVLVWSIDTLPNKTSVPKKDLPRILIYPNPTMDYINIEGLEIGGKIELFDIEGNRLMSLLSEKTNLEFLDIKSLSAGLYTIRITTQEGNVGTIKVTKN